MSCDDYCPKPVAWGSEENEGDGVMRREENNNETVFHTFFSPYGEEGADGDDELLDFDFPSIDGDSVTSYDASSYALSQRTQSLQTQRTQSLQTQSKSRRVQLEGESSGYQDTSFDQDTSFEGVRFLPDSTRPLSTVLEVLDGDEENRPPEHFADEINVELADDSTVRMMNKSRRDKTGRPLASRDGLALEHTLPSQQDKLLQNSLHQKSKRQLWKWIGFLSFLLLVAGTAYIYFDHEHQKEKNAELEINLATGSSANPLPTPAPTLGPTMKPSVNPIRNTLAFEMLSSKIGNPDLLLDSNTPQGKAFEKILAAQEGGSRLLSSKTYDAASELRTLQRFSLMVVFFATGGEERWMGDRGFRDFEDNECGWLGVTGCAEIAEAGGAKAITSFTLTANNIAGELPEEICLLENLEQLKLNRNLLSGNIPECLTTMPNLKKVDLRYNQITGRFPSSFFMAPSLEVLILSGNKLSGDLEIPDFSINRNQFRAMRTLMSVRLDNNELTGTVDDALMFLTKLGTLTLHGNNLRGNLDFMCVHEMEDLTADCGQITCNCCTECY